MDIIQFDKIVREQEQTERLLKKFRLFYKRNKKLFPIRDTLMVDSKHPDGHWVERSMSLEEFCIEHLQDDTEIKYKVGGRWIKQKEFQRKK